MKFRGAISLQSHKHRSEHWIVVEGIAKVTIENEISLLKQGQSILYLLAQSIVWRMIMKSQFC